MISKFLFAFIISFSALAASKKIVVNVPHFTEGPVYLTGDIPGYCFWKANCLKLEKIGHRSYAVNLDLPSRPSFFEVKVTLGTWEKQWANSAGKIWPNQKIINNERVRVFNVASWSHRKLWTTLGNLHLIENFYSQELDTMRTIRVWMPPNYFKEKKHYPVLYVHDGQNAFDRYSSAFGNEWGLDEIMTDLIKRKKVKDAIVVAVNSGQERNSEYTYLKKGKLYAKFLIETLKPFIDRHYRTLSSKEHTFLMGSSMGALISFTILWNHSDVFSKAAGLSLPAFAHDNQIFKFLETYPTSPSDARFYMDHGGIGQDSQYAEPARQLQHKLINDYQLNPNYLVYRTFPFADHTELDWSRRLEIPLTFLLGQ